MSSQAFKTNLKSVPRSLQTSALHRGPFALLGVSNRDDRRKIVEQAEERSLELNNNDCQKARSDLTNLRSRLTAEIAWLPGISPRKASQLLDELLNDAMSIRNQSGLPTIARCNLMAAAFEAVNGDDTAEDLSEFIQEMAHLVEELDADELIRDINEDRTISGFPEVKAIDQIAFEISERKRFFKVVIKDALNRLPSATLLDVMTRVVDGGTVGGLDHGPELIHDIVDSYAVEIQGILEKESENVQKLIIAARDSIKGSEEAIRPLIDKIERVVRNWDKFAQPIQLSAKSRGVDHEQSRDLALSIRSFAIELFNEHDMLVFSQRLTDLLQERFSELPEVSERVAEDAIALADIHKERKQAAIQSKKRDEEWLREITFTADVGVLFKDALSISSDGIEWKGSKYSLESITGVRWGSVRNSVNGIPTGTDYQIAIATRFGSTTINLKKESTYSGFLNSLWRAVCIRLMIEMSEALKGRASLDFGNMTIENANVTLVRHKFLVANEKVCLAWSDVHVWSENGEFFIGSRHDKKIYGSASYISEWNTHLLDHIVRGGFKKGVSKLSDYFD